MLNDKLVKFCENNFDDGKLILTKLSEYKKILLKENETMNLIGKSTIIDLDERHFLDCIQIVKYLPRHEKSVMDIGTGAGLPGNDRTPVRRAVRDHRLRPGFPTAQRRVTRRACRAACHQGLPRVTRRRSAHRLPHPSVRPRNQRHLGCAGRHAGASGGHGQRRRNRYRRPPRQARPTRRHRRCHHADLPLYTRGI